MGKTEKPEKAKKVQKHFWKDFKNELKKVIWPTRSQVINNTLIVIAIVLVVTAIVFVLDFAFEALNTYGIDKLKETVQSWNVDKDSESDNQNELEVTPTPDDMTNVENNS